MLYTIKGFFYQKSATYQRVVYKTIGSKGIWRSTASTFYGVKEAHPTNDRPISMVE